MKKHPLTIHLAWALLAGVAWWLGTQHGAPDSDRQPDTRSRPASAASSRGSSPHAGGESLTAAGSHSESVVWLRPWSGADGRISPEKMSEAVLEAMRDPDPVRRLRHFTHLLECLTPENAPAAMSALKANPGARDAGSWVALLCAAWGAQDGAAAMASLTESGERGAALTGWARSNPAAAQEWLHAFPVSPGPGPWGDLEQSLVRGMAQHDVAAALAYISAQSEGRRGDLARVLTGEQFSRGAPAAAQWAAELPDPVMRGAALEAVARHYMEVDPGAGAAWGAEISSAPDTREAVARVADRMAEKDVRAAFAWTLQLPVSPGQEEAFQQVFSEWARQDPGASSEELRSMAPGRERDNAIHSFSRILVNESPGDAIVWATAISDPALRLDTQIDVARTWNAASPAEAQTWIAAHLPADAQARALARE